MAKHLNAAQRKLQKQERSAMYSANDKKRLEEARRIQEQKELEEKKKMIRSVATAQEKKEDKDHGQLKSKAKAAGVKSVFVVDDQVVMTSFGKGNEAILEKSADGARVITTLNRNDPQYDASYTDKQFAITGKIAVDDGKGEKKPVQTTLQDNYASALTDETETKAALEQRYYGKTFNDNIHIQIIYNILDIEKLLAPHVNNIIYSLGALRSEHCAIKDEDLVGLGYITTKNLYSEVSSGVSSRPGINAEYLSNSRNAFSDLFGDKNSQTRKRLAYYGDLFYKSTGKDKWEIKDDQTLYNLVALVSDLRQFCVHDYLDEEKIGQNNIWGRAFLYNLEKCLNDDVKRLLDDLFSHKAGALKATAFGKSAGKSDVTILLRVFGKQNASQEEQVALLQEFYDFQVKKEYKNLGFSIKKLREAILLQPGAQVYGNKEDDKMNSIRHKLYNHIDFIIAKYFKDQYAELTSIQKNDIFASLRAARSDEEKDAIYLRLAAPVWQAIRNKVEIAYNEIKCYISTKEKSEYKAEDSLFECIKGIPETVSYFSELMYLLTKFLDGKEINTLCTSLIHKLENIASLDNVLQQANLERNIRDNYKFFEDAGIIADELRQVNNMARMSVPLNDVSIKLAMYRDAADVLGLDPRYDEDSLLEQLLNMDTEATDRKILCKFGKPVLKKGKIQYDMNYRNFIINNVISSRRFIYLVRFVDPKKIRKLAVNPEVIRFVLKEIPDDQIKRYFSAVGETRLCSFDEMRRCLAERLTKVNFLDFRDVDNRGNGEKKQQMQAIVRLYLTVPYLFVKNLVNVNSRYVIAFHCLERDRALTKGERNYVQVGLTEESIEQRKKKIEQLEAEYAQRKAAGEKCHTGPISRLKHQLYLKDNNNNTTNGVRGTYRNAVVHLNIITHLADLLPDNVKITSYFSVYHLCMQRHLKDERYPDVAAGIGENQKKTLAYFDAVERTGTYCKDFVKALNAPFGYNLPRFKNLSIETLFDMHIKY